MNMGMAGLLVAVVVLAIVSVFFAYQWYTSVLSYRPEFQSLETEYSELLSRYNSLMTNYTNLENSYNTLQSRYTSLQSQYNTVQSMYNSLMINYTNLQTEYNECVSMQAPYTTSGTQTTLPPGTYYGISMGMYTPYTNSSLDPGTYVFTTQTPTIFYLLISPQPITSIQGSSLPQGTLVFMGENSITLTLKKPENVAILTPTQTQLTITYNGKPLYITAIQSAPNSQNSCGYNGYPYGYQGCGPPIYIVLWLTDGTHYFYVNGAPFCTGFTANPVMGETAIPIGSANTCSGVTINS